MEQKLASQYVPPDCERVDPGAESGTVYLLRDRLDALDRVVAVARCRIEAGACGAAYGMRAVAGGPLLARSGRPEKAGPETRRNALRLTPAGRRLLARRHSVRVRVGRRVGRHGVAAAFTSRLVLSPAEP